MNQNHQEVLPAAIGSLLAGGYFAGIINLHGEAHAIVVAPKDGGETELPWNGSAQSVTGATSYFDGQQNTAAMAEAGSELAQWARDLRLGDFDDWYLPSRDELEVIYRNLKPTTERNVTYRSGDNPSSVPPGYPYTETMPSQTSVADFQSGGAQAFEDNWYWSSTQHASYTEDAWYQVFDNGLQYGNHKSYAGRARAVRRFKL